MKLLNLALIFVCVLSVSGAAFSDDAGPAWSYSQPDSAKSIKTTVDNLLAWANGELAEHVGEGLFDAYPQDKKLIESMILTSKTLVQQAEQAEQKGDSVSAQSLYYAAEAAARYAANMPHMLEDRLTGH